MNIIAGIVLYNPNVNRLKENVEAIFNQVNSVVLIDNGSANVEEIIKIFNGEKIIIIKNKKNLGIAAALNQILNHALENNIDWVLTLDQDSVVSENIIEQYSKYISLNNIGMISCRIVDRNFELDNKEVICNEKMEYINLCITSGCLTNVKAWKESGGFDEKMFIDFVDFDMCKKMIQNGYKLIKVNTTSILHELGHSKVKSIFGKEFVLYNHVPIRNYYIARNKVYFTRKYKKGGLALKSYASVLWRGILILLFENCKFQKIKFVLKGFLDGFIM